MTKWHGISIALGLLAALALYAGHAAWALGAEMEGIDMQNIHHKLSTQYFNDCWTIIDKPDRSPDDVENMLLLAYASLWHWKQRGDCKPLNLSVGYWQVSRVHALAGQYEMARLFGEKCLKIGKDNKLPPFYLGYAYEALARAEALHKDSGAARDCLAAAKEQLAEVKEKEDAELLRADLTDLEKSIPK
ncbi:MAG: hypothetical protein QME66_06805 [Candidatus Eisenbacteria bacterium]|nr:hypothetical protein [Candidatus Eisenbacteria bacterium]